MSPAFAPHRHTFALALPSEVAGVRDAVGLTGLLIVLVLVLIGLLARSPGAMTIG